MGYGGNGLRRYPHRPEPPVLDDAVGAPEEQLDAHTLAGLRAPRTTKMRALSQTLAVVPV